MTIDQIRNIMNQSGSHWFDRNTMSFFGTRIESAVYGTSDPVFFVTSEKPPWGPRKYSVREFCASEKKIRTIGEFCSMEKDEALEMAESFGSE